jgi:hypothetical protein
MASAMSASKTSKLVIFGDQDFAQLAYEYFTYDSPYEVVGFVVDQAFKKTEHLCENQWWLSKSQTSDFRPANTKCMSLWCTAS